MKTVSVNWGINVCWAAAMLSAADSPAATAAIFIFHGRKSRPPEKYRIYLKQKACFSIQMEKR